jgi:phage-related protein
MTAPAMPLTIKITSNSFKGQKDRILSAQFGNGFNQVAPDGLNSIIDTWSIQYMPLRGTDLTTINTFLATVGVTTWFTWTPLGETVSKKWRIDKDSIQKKMINTSTFLISFTMTQQFDLGT